MYAALNIALTVAEIKVAQVVLTKLGVPIAKWLAKTKAGKAVINTVESTLEKGAEKAKLEYHGDHFLLQGLHQLISTLKNYVQ